MNAPLTRAGKTDVQAVRVDSLFPPGVPGSFIWTGLHGFPGGPYGINFRCPCGCDSIYGASFDNHPEAWLSQGGKQGRWHWDGDREKPTLTPSLGLYKHVPEQRVGPDGYHWHGFLRAGVFEEC